MRTTVIQNGRNPTGQPEVPLCSKSAGFIRIPSMSLVAIQTGAAQALSLSRHFRLNNPSEEFRLLAGCLGTTSTRWCCSTMQIYASDRLAGASTGGPPRTVAATTYRLDTTNKGRKKRMKITVSNCRKHQAYRCVLRGDRTKQYLPEHTCPECACRDGVYPYGSKELCALIRRLRKIHENGRLTVAEPISGKILRNPEIACVANNFGMLQISLVPEWWPEGASILAEESYPPWAGYPGWKRIYDKTDQGTETSLIANRLRTEHKDSSILLWEPCSRRLVCLDPQKCLCATHAGLEIVLPDNWLL